MRNLNETEKEIVSTLKSRNKIVGSAWLANTAKVTYLEEGNFTTAIVQLSAKRIAVGITKRNPKDAYVEHVARSLAFTRALKSKAVAL
jgi:hypothetical protein